MSRPRLLDLFCGAGGASVGYHRAGFEVVGVDMEPQPNYPFEFYRDMAQFVPLDGFDAIHASPPCQGYSTMSTCRPGLATKYPRLVGVTRQRLAGTGVPYVIENVPGAPLVEPVELCGHMFGLDLYRHRLFETNWRMIAPEHPAHVRPTLRAGRWQPGTVMSVVGHCAPIAQAKRAMGIDWMTRDELVEAVPPAYTEHIGRQLIEQLRSSEVAA